MYDALIFILALWFFLAVSSYFLVSRLGGIAFDEFLRDLETYNAQQYITLNRKIIQQSMLVNAVKVSATTGFLIMFVYIFFDSNDFELQFKKEFKDALHKTIYKVK